jgi:hypothetical protein
VDHCTCKGVGLRAAERGNCFETSVPQRHEVSTLELLHVDLGIFPPSRGESGQRLSRLGVVTGEALVMSERPI